MNEIDNLFFQLIRVAIGTQESPSTGLRAGLSRLPSEVEWEELFEMAVKQSLVGVCFFGLHSLGADSDEGFAQIGMSEDLYFDWMGMAAQINMKNELVNQQCVELQKRLAADGIRSSIMKGQAVAMLYGEELCGFRQSGDIDIYVDCGREKAIEYARSIQGEVDWDYKHLHLKVFDDTAVEMHYVPEVFLNLRKNRKLQKWFKEPEVASSMFRESGDLVCPSVEFNLFYILLHTYRHFLYEGVGMRQLMDYYFVLRTSYENQNENFVALIKQSGMTRFTKGVMWIMAHVFANENENSNENSNENCRQNGSLDSTGSPTINHKPSTLNLPIEPDEKEGRYILSEVMTGGNFGYHDERLATKTKTKTAAVKKILRHNLHLLAHYPGDTLWAPVWIVYHWMWKRGFQRKLKRKLK